METNFKQNQSFIQLSAGHKNSQKKIKYCSNNFIDLI